MNKNKTLSARLVLLMTLCLPAFALAQEPSFHNGRCGAVGRGRRWSDELFGYP